MMERDLLRRRQLIEPNLLCHLTIRRCWERDLPHLCKPVRPPLGTLPQQPPPSPPEPPLAANGPQPNCQGRRSRRSRSRGVSSSDWDSLPRRTQHHTGRAADAAAVQINNK